MALVRFGETLRQARVSHYAINACEDRSAYPPIGGLSSVSSIFCLALSRNDLFGCLLILPARSFEAKERLNILDEGDRW